jgi:uncharacterized protein GlcG (DUF336 family)
MRNKLCLSCADIKAVMAARLAAAEKNNWTATIAIVDKADLATLDRQR